MSGTKKFEIIRVAQENQHLYKRLTERGSFYHVDQWEKDYQKNQYYKSNHCIYPVINFCHTDSNYPRYKSNTGRYSKYNKTVSHYHINCRNTTSNERINTQDENMPKILYNKTDYILHLELCYIEFSVHTQR